MARWRRALTSLPAIIAAGVFALYLLAGYFLVGPVAQWALPRYAQDKLDSRASVTEVKFDPLRLTLRIKNLRLTQPNGSLLAGCRAFYTQLEWSSLLRFAWHLRALDVDGLTVRLAVAKDGRLNWDGLLAALQRSKSPPSKTMPRVLISHLRLSGGDIEYEDASGSKPFATSLSPISLELNDLSTLPRDTGGYTLSASLPALGATLKWSGRIGLNPLFSQGRAALENLSLARASRAIKLPHAWAVDGGVLSVSSNYRVQAPGGRLVLQATDLRLALAKLALAIGHGLKINVERVDVRNGAYDGRTGRAGWQRLDFAGIRLARNGLPMLRLDQGQAAGLGVDLKGHRASLDALKLAGGEVDAGIDAAGRLDWESAFLPAAAHPASAVPAATPAGPTKPWEIALTSLDLSGIGARFADQRFVHPLLLDAQGFHLNAAVAGAVGGAQDDWSVTGIAAGVGPLRMQSGPVAAASIGAINLTGGRFDLAQRSLQVDSLTINAPATRVVREKDGALNWRNFLAQRPSQAAAVAQERPPGRQGGMAPLRFSLARLEVQGANVAVEDLTPPKPMRLDMTEGRIVLSHLSQDLRHPVPMSLALRVGGSGKLVAEGDIVPAQPSGYAQVRLSGLPLAPFAPYVNQFARLRLKSGSASTSGRLEFSVRGRPAVAYRGGFAVDNLAIAEEDSGEPFLGWRSLRGRGLDIALDPGHLNLRELVADRPFGKIIINADKSLNLKNVLRTRGEEKSAAPAAKPGMSSTVEVKKGAGFPISVRQILIHQGDLQFADLSLKPQFGARIEDFGGAISGLSSRADASAQVELDGRVGQYGSAQVRGRLQPFAATDNTDLTLKFRNLEMNPLSPYSGKFAGRLIDSGRLSVDLQYKIKHRQLAGENRFVISQLKLGSAVDSPNAVKLPLDLAIALLENSQGVIDVDIPISGNLDDPKFSYGHLIWQAVLNLLTKVVTAPFRALGALLGVDSNKFGTIDFRYGEAELTPPQLDTLNKVGEALSKRPNLQLVVAPTFDPERDAAALQELTLRREVAQRLRLSVPQGTRPPPIDANDRVTRLAVEELYDQAFPGGISALRAEIKPEDIVALYREAIRRLEKHIVIPQSRLEELARARAQAIVAEMVKAPGMAAGRVSMGQGYAKVEGQAPELAMKLDLRPSPVPAASSPAATPGPAPSAVGPAP